MWLVDVWLDWEECDVRGVVREPVVHVTGPLWESAMQFATVRGNL